MIYLLFCYLRGDEGGWPAKRSNRHVANPTLSSVLVYSHIEILFRVKNFLLYTLNLCIYSASVSVSPSTGAAVVSTIAELPV